jgi:hypothetical protein
MEWAFLEKVVCLGNAELASHLDNEGLSFNSLVITRSRDLFHEWAVWPLAWQQIDRARGTFTT